LLGITPLADHWIIYSRVVIDRRVAPLLSRLRPREKGNETPESELNQACPLRRNNKKGKKRERERKKKQRRRPPFLCVYLSVHNVGGRQRQHMVCWCVKKPLFPPVSSDLPYGLVWSAPFCSVPASSVWCEITVKSRHSSFIGEQLPCTPVSELIR
jgi:hypothetical protein